jgi:hypothetical protein
VPAALTNAEGRVSMTVTPLFSGSFPADIRFADLSSGGTFVLRAPGGGVIIQAADGTNTPSQPSFPISGTPKIISMSWSDSANELAVTSDGIAVTQAFATPTLDQIVIGAQPSGSAPVIIKNVTIKKVAT